MSLITYVFQPANSVQGPTVHLQGIEHKKGIHYRHSIRVSLHTEGATPRGAYPSIWQGAEPLSSYEVEIVSELFKAASFLLCSGVFNENEVVIAMKALNIPEHSTVA